MLFLLIHSSLVFSFDNLQKGVGITEENGSALRSTSIPYAIARQGQRAADNNVLVEAYLEVTDSVYSLSSKPNLIKTKNTDSTLLGNWPLTRWPHLNIPAEYLQTKKYFTPKSEIVGDASYSKGGSIGCLSNSPLRYGNVLSTTENDIVLTLNSQFFIFSPSYKRVVFEEYYDHSDWLYGADANEIRADIRVDSQDQYISGLYTGLPAARTGYRGYSKLFVGDYDKDGNTDVLVWRKIYRSNNKSNPVLGFSLMRNEWQHFERDLVAQAALPAGITGDVLPQPTDAATIQSWLSENQLTWSKGYPSLSECAGQETQLIPEMHDLLLNDPDVMQ